MFKLTIVVDFEAAHCIRDYPGKCSRLHGHNWKIEVLVAGTMLNELGMLIDFHDLKAEVHKVIDTLDHQYLNDITPFNQCNPTAENIAKYIYEQLCKRPAFIDTTVKISSVTVWESSHSAVTYSEVES